MVEIDGYGMRNNRYHRLEELQSGSFATIYKCQDLMVSADGTEISPIVGAPRLLSEAHQAMVSIIAKDSPQIEYVRADPEDFSDEKKEAIRVLQSLETVFPDNNRYPAIATDQIVQNPRVVAVKKSKVNAFNDRDGVLFYALREAQILQRLQGQRHVCQLLDIFVSGGNAPSINLVTEFCPKSLDQLLIDAHGARKQKSVAAGAQQRESSEEEEEESKMTEAAPGFLTQAHVKDLMRQILTGLTQMHERGIWHRDVKTDNIMLDADGVVKFIDFNISKLIDGGVGSRHTKNVVTRNFRPPEIFFGDVNYDGQRVDAWSVGCVFGELLANDGSFFPADSDIEQLCNIFEVTGTPSIEDWPEVENLPTYLPFNPVVAKDLGQVVQDRRDKVKTGAEVVEPVAIDLLSKLLTLNPAKRILVGEALAHPYFQQ